MPYAIIYLSSASSLLDKIGVEKIMDITLVNNEVHNISGFLVYKEGTFLQLLEGEEDDVKKIYGRVELDYRHKNIIPIMHQPTQQRAFDSYYSGFRICDNPLLLDEFKGYVRSIEKLPDSNIKKTVHLVHGILNAM